METGDEEPIIADIPGLSSLLGKSSLDYDYTTQPQAPLCNNTCEWNRGKVMGGSSTINGMLYVRGNKFDYDNWAKLGNVGWDWQNALKYFKKAEDFKIADVSV